MNNRIKKHALRLAVLASVYGPHATNAGEVTFDGTLAPAGGRAAGSLPATNGTFTVNQSDGVTRGGNLFHSFGRFNLDAGETGLFTTSSSAITNVISRVTGGQQSTINGTLRLSALQGGTPNLFLINPSGVTLGPSAVVDVPGSFFLSTANNLTFDDGSVFATDARSSTVLTAATPQSFGFLTDSPRPVSIRQLASLDSVKGATTIVGGNIDITATAAFSVLSQDRDRSVLALGSIASAGNVPVGFFQPSDNPFSIVDSALRPEFAAFARLGSVTISGTAMDSDLFDFSRFLAVVADSINVSNVTLPYTEYVLNARQDITLNSARFTGSVNAPTGRLSADRIAFLDSRIDLTNQSFVQARTQLVIDNSTIRSDEGDFRTLRFDSGGDLSITNSRFVANRSAGIRGLFFTGRNVMLDNSVIDFAADGEISFRAIENLRIDRTRIFAASADRITINGRRIEIDNSSIDLTNPGRLGFLIEEDPEFISIGNCAAADCVHTESIFIGNSQIRTTSTADLLTTLIDRSPFRDSFGRSAAIIVSADDISLVSSTLMANTEVDDISCTSFECAPDFLNDPRIGDAGAITINAADGFTMTGDSSRITASTTGRGDAGQVSINAGSIDISGGIVESRNDLVASNIGKPLGAAGSITLTADSVALGNVIISTDTTTDNAGAAPASISITSRQGDLTLDNTLIFARTSSVAAAGSVSLDSSGAISLTRNAIVLSTTANAGSAGSISVAAAGNVSLSGSRTTLSTATSSTGAAGNIQLGTEAQRIGSLTLADGATIQANSNGAGTGGSISGFVAGDALISARSLIDASTTGSGNAGDISLSAARLEVNSANIESRTRVNVAGQPLGTAGSVTLNADRLILDNAGITTDTLSTNDNAEAASITLSSRNDLQLTNSRVTATTGTGTAAGSITLSNTGGAISLQDGAMVATTTNATGAAGNVAITASGNVAIQSGATVRSESTTTTNDAGRAGTINVTGNAVIVDGGTVLASINGGNTATPTADVVLTATTGNVDVRNRAQVTADTSGAAAGGSVRLVTPATVSLSDTGTVVSSSSTGSGTAGSIQLGTATQRLGGFRIANGAAIQASTSGAGGGGAINGFVAGDAVVAGPSRISASTTGSGDAGGVSLRAARLEVSGGTIESRSSAAAADASLGTAGSVALDADRLLLGAATISTDTASTNADATAASITLSSRNELQLAGTQVTATTATGTAAGSITLSNTGGAISLQDGATVATTTNATGAAGNIAIAATGSVALQSSATIRSESTATTLDAGRAGTIDIAGDAIAVDGSKILASIDGGSATTPTADVVLTARTGSIDVRNRAQITVDTSGAAAGGNVSFVTPGTAAIAGAGTSVSSSTTGSGAAGSIQLGTAAQRLGALRIANGAAVQANTSSTGNGGAINVFVAGDATLTGAGSTLATNATDAGDGGTITVAAASMQLTDGARIQSTAMGSGDSGAIALNIARDLRLTDSAPESFATQTAILTSAQQSSGGNITATVGGTLLLASSRIESSVATAAGKGGDINLQTQGLLLSSSQIFARADQGNGGGITIARRNDLPPGPFLVDANSSISAQSRAAVSGAIAIDATDTNVTTVIDPLAASLAQTPALAANPCSARQSGAPSTFVRDTDGGVAPLPDNYFTAGILATPSALSVAATPNEKITLAALVGATSPCVR